MSPEPLHHAVVRGAVTGAAVWSAEVVAVAALNADVGGVSVLLALTRPLCRWGLVYLLTGAALGVTSRWVGAVGPVLGWLGLVLVADVGVAPRWLTGALVMTSVAVSLGLTHFIRQRTLLAALALLTGLLLLGSPGVPTSSPRGRVSADPDVILVVVDTLRADHVGVYGYERPTTPVLDALAGEGLRFTAARSTASWTLPAHASLFTGMLPSEHGAHASHPLLTDDLPTLAERLQARGYRTVGLSANAWVSGGTGLDRGFQRFSFLGADAISSQLLLPLALAAPEDLGGRQLTDAAVEEIAAAAEAEEPLFLFVNYLEAHEPLGTLPEPARTRFADRPLDPTLGRRWVRELPYFWCACEAERSGLACEEGLFRADRQRIADAVDLYDAGIAYVDGLIGELRDALVRADRFDQAVVVVTSDHGEHLGEEGRLGHMVWLTEPLLDVPLIVRAPGRLEANTVDDAPIDLAGFHNWLLALLDGDPLPRSSLATSETHPHPAALRARWEALFGCDFGPAGLHRRRQLGHDGDDHVELPGEAGAEEPLSPETRAALRSLGYIQ